MTGVLAVLVFAGIVTATILVGHGAEFLPVLATGLGGVALFLTQRGAERAAERDNIAISRERVRAAERDFEVALRAAQGSPEEQPRQSRDAQVTQPPETVAPAARLTLPELWTVTHSRLDLYHDIATGQAQRSFRNAQAAMICGFVLLIIFVVVALNASTTAGSLVAGGLGAVSAALAGFVSRTFVKSQETAAAHLRAYFDQPLEFSRYLAAERLVADAGLASEQRAEVLTALVQAMVTPPGSSPALGGPRAPAEDTQPGA
ncbi:hypothetical protein ACIGMX_34730 [Streptomyces aquilus]|uniref:TRADD-N-associated membrane domain-containing protein n=1 Tax=Streptomyces aquilus TaxID=2548456 RepID=UPI0037D80550